MIRFNSFDGYSLLVLSLVTVRTEFVILILSYNSSALIPNAIFESPWGKFRLTASSLGITNCMDVTLERPLESKMLYYMVYSNPRDG